MGYNTKWFMQRLLPHILMVRIIAILLFLFACSNIHADTSATTSTTVYTHKNYDAIGEHVIYLAETEQPLCIILLDLDRFKSINDTHGHAGGDLTLKNVAAILNNTVRDGDVLARWGGEEFAILLPQTSLKQAIQIAERIRVSISKAKIKSGTEKISTTASLGVAIKNDDILSIDDLFKVADINLYHAKQNGRNMVCTTLDQATN